MRLLEETIEREGKILGNGIIKVDSFMNHQINPALMKEIGLEFSRHLQALRPTRILTAETSGIAPALACAMTLNIPVVFARKQKPITMDKGVFSEQSLSHTKGQAVELHVSPEYLKAEDRVLIIDDFLATARTIRTLVNLVKQSGATVVGIGAVIEKSFEGGREQLRQLNVPIVSLAIIDRFDGERVVFKTTAPA